MGTFPLHFRHLAEQAMSEKIQRKVRAEVDVDERTWPLHAGGDHRYRVPTIGLNQGAIPGTRPGTA